MFFEALETMLWLNVYILYLSRCPSTGMDVDTWRMYAVHHGLSYILPATVWICYYLSFNTIVSCVYLCAVDVEVLVNSN